MPGFAAKFTVYGSGTTPDRGPEGGGTPPCTPLFLYVSVYVYVYVSVYVSVYVEFGRDILLTFRDCHIQLAG
jgi:hypothetical protein